MTIGNDEELNKLLSGVTITQEGVLTNHHTKYPVAKESRRSQIGLHKSRID